MRAYELSYSVNEQAKRQFAETQKDARDKRRTIMEKESLKIADVTIAQVEIPTKKPELLAWINDKTS